MFKLLTNRRNQIASCAANDMAMYSASVDDNATTPCFFDIQDTVAPPSMKMKPDLDFLVIVSPAQSASEYLNIEDFARLEPKS